MFSITVPKTFVLHCRELARLLCRDFQCTAGFSFSSYVLTGTEKGMKQTFGTTCHGAVSDFHNNETT